MEATCSPGGGETLDRLGAPFECADDAIVGKTPDGIITGWNPGAQMVFGYAPADVIGQPVTMLFPAERLSEEEDILARVRSGDTVANLKTVRMRKEGQCIDVSATIFPVFDAAGAIVGACKIVRDITGRRLARQALEEQCGILQLTSVMARDLAGVITFWRSGSRKALWLSPG